MLFKTKPKTLLQIKCELMTFLSYFQKYQNVQTTLVKEIFRHEWVNVLLSSGVHTSFDIDNNFEHDSSIGQKFEFFGE